MAQNTLAPKADYSSTEEQIIRNVYDLPTESLKVKVTNPVPVEFIAGENEVEISADDGDSILIVGTEDGTTGGIQHAIKTDDEGRVEIAGNVSITGGTFEVEPPSDFRAGTYTITGVATAITFTGIVLQSISIKAPSDNVGNVRIGKSDVATNFYLMSPGESVNLFVTASSSPVYFMADTGASGQISVLASGNPP